MFIPCLEGYNIEPNELFADDSYVGTSLSMYEYELMQNVEQGIIENRREEQLVTYGRMSYMQLEGIETMLRMADYLDAGGDPNVLEMLFDMHQYNLPGYFTVGMEDDSGGSGQQKQGFFAKIGTLITRFFRWVASLFSSKDSQLEKTGEGAQDVAKRASDIPDQVMNAAAVDVANGGSENISQIAPDGVATQAVSDAEKADKAKGILGRFKNAIGNAAKTVGKVAGAIGGGIATGAGKVKDAAVATKDTIVDNKDKIKNAAKSVAETAGNVAEHVVAFAKGEKIIPNDELVSKITQGTSKSVASPESLTKTLGVIKEIADAVYKGVDPQWIADKAAGGSPIDAKRQLEEVGNKIKGLAQNEVNSSVTLQQLFPKGTTDAKAKLVKFVSEYGKVSASARELVKTLGGQVFKDRVNQLTKIMEDLKSSPGLKTVGPDQVRETKAEQYERNLRSIDNNLANVSSANSNRDAKKKMAAVASILKTMTGSVNILNAKLTSVTQVLATSLNSLNTIVTLAYAVDRSVRNYKDVIKSMQKSRTDVENNFGSELWSDTKNSFGVASAPHGERNVKIDGQNNDLSS